VAVLRGPRSSEVLRAPHGPPGWVLWHGPRFGPLPAPEQQLALPLAAGGRLLLPPHQHLLAAAGRAGAAASERRPVGGEGGVAVRNQRPRGDALREVAHPRSTRPSRRPRSQRRLGPSPRSVTAPRRRLSRSSSCMLAHTRMRAGWLLGPYGTVQHTAHAYTSTRTCTVNTHKHRPVPAVRRGRTAHGPPKCDSVVGSESPLPITESHLGGPS
jgi:hypothetical protein